MPTDELKGRTALVTGASSGVGAAFARNLAARGAAVIVTARREDRLTALAAEIAAAHGRAPTVIALDLSEPDAAERLFALTEGAGTPIDVLVNNAGGGIQAHFADIPWERTKRQIQLNVTSLVELTWRFANAMRARGRPGHILNVSSVGAYSPTPTFATYSAGKVFVRDFSEAIAYELRGTEVRVCSLCPGLVSTEFAQSAGQTVGRSIAWTAMSPETCAEIGLRALFNGRRNIVSGWINAVSMWFTRFLPRRTLTWSAALTMGPPTTKP